ncbi:5'/3'-nucleotidase SurE [Acaryochloris sp. IP29b_bin.137]|uniref:5'/3'-nucleotidase SurE n=1 Tax=Acaryochloris sp. IP29b_bin.137 TaxID=2969217 RepID=UPI002613E64F|nr:5'/3'-nucleotidase SurE [Acaryochloris sp. IP29b_bin.137]
MTGIITNDDGIDAPGLAALTQAIDQPALIIAPQTHHSGCGHQVTTSGPITLEKRSNPDPQGTMILASYGIGGTPVDCVRVALQHLCPSLTWVLSGINAGGNLGSDIYVSGTVAAVREAALHHIPGIAISQYHRRDYPVDWSRSTRWAQQVIKYLWAQPLPPQGFWNVNLPHLPPEAPDPAIVQCPLSKKPLPISYRQEEAGLVYRGDYHHRDREPGSDVDTCFQGNIAVTQIQL